MERGDRGVGGWGDHVTVESLATPQLSQGTKTTSSVVNHVDGMDPNISVTTRQMPSEGHVTRHLSGALQGSPGPRQAGETTEHSQQEPRRLDN